MIRHAPMDDRARITAAATALAEAIGRKDAAAVDRLLAPDFRLRTPGGASTPRAVFIEAVCAIPAEVQYITVYAAAVVAGEASTRAEGSR